MPARIRAGYTLQEEDVQQIEELFQRRDDWIEHYQKKELRDSGRIQQYIGHIHQVSQKIAGVNDRIKRVRLDPNPLHWADKLRTRRKQTSPLADQLSSASLESGAAGSLEASVSKNTVAVATVSSEPAIPFAGYASEVAPARGLWWDNWMGNPFEYRLGLHQPVCGVEIDGYLAEPHSALRLTIDINGHKTPCEVKPSGFFTLRAACALGQGAVMALRVASDGTFSPARAGVSEDARELMIHLREIRLLHPPPEV
jgi:hypothetical protein